VIVLNMHSRMLKVCFTENSEVFAIRVLNKHGELTPEGMRRGMLMAVSKSMPILIVDDYNTMIRILRNLLRQLGFSNIDEASDGRTALAKMKTKDYALVISDWGMEPMTGTELLEQVRADDRMRATPFLMVANDNDGDLDADCIVKPFNAQALKTKLVSVLGAF
jgi:two-component system chemotaxis response regulator CheY